MCIRHWNSNKERYSHFYNKWQDQNIGNVFLPEEGAQSQNFPRFLGDDK